MVCSGAHFLAIVVALQCLTMVIASPNVDEGHCAVEGCVSKGNAFIQRVAPSMGHVMFPADGFDEDSHQAPSLVDVGVTARISVISYNLYWWNVRQNSRWSELWNRIRSESPFDLIGFQECEDVASVLRNSGLAGFEYYQGPTPNPAPLAWNGQTFSKIGGPGNKWVASDRWGNRHFTWVRLRHNPSGSNIFFANTHGPLENCGESVGNNWVGGVNSNKQAGDIVFMTGDFNCGTGTPAMNLLKGQLPVAVDGGIDQILSDTGKKESGGKREGSPSDHPLIKGSFTLSGSGVDASPRRRRTPSTATQFGGATSNCAAFSGWPDIDGGVTCRSCSALVSTGPYDGRCDRYCESFGHRCIAAAEEQADNCQIKYSTGCNQAIPDTSDMLCACEKVGATGDSSSSCSDGNGQCSRWADLGECSKNPNYMLANCKRSCNACTSSGTGSLVSSCQDANSQCAYWASTGECNRNPQYMSVNCKKSCNIC